MATVNMDRLLEAAGPLATGYVTQASRALNGAALSQTGAAERERLLMVPNQRHGYGPDTAYIMRRRWDYLVKNLLGAEPPKEYEMGGRRPIS